MREDLRTCQLRSYEALVLVSEICKKNKIEYFLLAGTFLGAVRHGGFIPWDDDIDIGMNYKNFIRFRNLTDIESLPREYHFHFPGLNKCFPRFHCKITYNGYHCIDVFPIVKTSNKKRSQKFQWICKKVLFAIYLRKIKHKYNYCNINPKRFFILIISKLLSLFCTRKWILKIAGLVMAMYETSNNRFCLNICSIYKMEKELIKTEWMEEMDLIDFEGNSFPVFKAHNDYLTHLYGDYMTLPPEHERLPSHSEQYFT